MSAILLQTIFYLACSLLLGIGSRHAWIEYKNSNSILSRGLALALFFASIEELLLGLPRLLIPQNLLIVKIFSLIAWIFVYLAIYYAGTLVIILYPKIPKTPWLLLVISAATLAIVINGINLKPAVINADGFIDVQDHWLSDLITNFMIAAAVIPFSLTVIIRTFKSKLLLKGGLIGGGLILFVIFFPLALTYPPKIIFTFSGILAIIGLLMLVMASNLPSKKL